MPDLYERQYLTEVQWENFPNTSTPLSRTNLRHMDSGITDIDTAVAAAINTLSTTKANQTDALTTITNVTFNADTGVFTFTKLNGSTITINTTLEQVVTNFAYDAETQRLVLTLSEIDAETGLPVKQYVDMSALIQQNDFVDSATIAASVEADGKVAFGVKNGSITGEKLQPNYLADVTQKASEAAASKNSAQQYALLSRSYARGDSNLEDRPTENVDNAKYYKDLALQAAQDAQAFTGLYDFTPPTSTAQGARGLVPAPPQKTNVPRALTEDGWIPNDAARIPYDTGYLNAYMPVYKDFSFDDSASSAAIIYAENTWVNGFYCRGYCTLSWDGMTAEDDVDAVILTGDYSSNYSVKPQVDSVIVYFEEYPYAASHPFTLRIFRTKGVEDPVTTSTVGGVVVTTGMIAQMIAPVEATSTAAAEHAVGDLIIYDGLLRLVTADIDPGDTIVPGTAGTPGTNVTTDTIGTELSSLLRRLESMEPSIVGTKLIFGGGAT